MIYCERPPFPDWQSAIASMDMTQEFRITFPMSTATGKAKEEQDKALDKAMEVNGKPFCGVHAWHCKRCGQWHVKEAEPNPISLSGNAHYRAKPGRKPKGYVVDDPESAD